MAPRILLVLVVLCIPSSPTRARPERSVAPTTSSSARFEANVGQFDREVRYAVRGGGNATYVTATGAVTVASAPTRLGPRDPFGRGLGVESVAPSSLAAVRMTLAGARAPRLVAGAELSGRANYLRGSDATAWRTNVPSYDGVRLVDVYEGVDLVYSGTGGRVEYDFVVSPGGDPGAIRLAFDGAEDLRIDEAGVLVLRTAVGEIRHDAPVVYQPTEGGRRRVAGRFVLRADGDVGFDVGAFDSSLPIVIDPVLAFAALLGGNGRDVATDVAVSGDSIWLTGFTRSADFPVRGAIGPYTGGIDAFVTKLEAGSAEPAYSTYVGGSFTDAATGLEVLGDGRVVVAGYTSSIDFPVVSPIFGTSAGLDGFVFELAASGAALNASTFLGGAGDDLAYGVAVDASEAIYVAGVTSSGDFPVREPIQRALAGGQDGFVAKLAPGARSLVYSTFLGGHAADLCVGGVAVDVSGAAVVTGHTASEDFPQRNSLQGFGGEEDAFVAKLTPDGAALVYSTFYGGDDAESGLAVAVDPAGHAYVAGTTTTEAFPSKLDATRHGDETDAFVVKLAVDGGSVEYAVPIRTLVPEVAQGIAVDANGSASVVGYCDDPQFPTTDPVQIPYGGTQDAFLATIDPSGSSVVFATKLGGRLQDQAVGVAVDDGGRVVVAGATASVDFPVVGDSLTSLVGDEDLFVVRVDPGDGPVPPSVAKAKAAGAGRSFKVTLKGAGFAPGAAVYVGDDLASWSPATVKTAKIMLKGGAALEAKFPPGVAVRVRIVNPDGGMAFASATR